MLNNIGMLISWNFPSKLFSHVISRDKMYDEKLGNLKNIMIALNVIKPTVLMNSMYKGYLARAC